MLDLRNPELLERLLGRPRRRLLRPGDRATIAGNRVLVTGAAGSVGSELARLIAHCRPESLTVLDQSEYGLFQLERELNQAHPSLDVRPVLGDVTRRRAIRQICRAERPDVVYHAAAYKHVGMLEGAVCTAIQANVLGSYYAGRAARECGSRFVLVSTDKAFWPSSVMGASKRLAELLALSLAREGFEPTVARFGNVLGSSGSVVELILDKITKGESITITHPDATRFFMSAEEAAALVLLVDAMRTPPGVYWLDMGLPVRIVDLGQRLLDAAQEAGLAPVPIEFCGLRPGEKLTEEFPTSDVVPCDSRTSLVYRLRDENRSMASAERLVTELQRHVARADAEAALGVLTETVPEFTPSVAARSTVRSTDALDFPRVAA